MSVCLNHTDTEAVTRCAACGKPLCANCIAFSENGRDYCSQTCYTRGTAAAERSAGVVSEKGNTAKSKFIRSLILLFLIIAIAAAGFMYYKNNKKQIDRKLDSTIQQTKAGEIITSCKRARNQIMTEPGETPEEALCREIQEELGVTIYVENHICTIEYDYPNFHLTIHCYWCSIVQGELVLNEHQSACWLEKSEWESVEWLPADIEVVKELQKYQC